MVKSRVMIPILDNSSTSAVDLIIWSPYGPTTIPVINNPMIVGIFKRLHKYITAIDIENIINMFKRMYIGQTMIRLYYWILHS